MARFQMTLASQGNPDFGQYAPISPLKGAEAETLDELRAKAEVYIEEWGLGGGNWLNPKVIKDGKVVGYMSYNRRVWVNDPAQFGRSQKNQERIEYTEEETATPSEKPTDLISRFEAILETLKSIEHADAQGIDVGREGEAFWDLAEKFAIRWEAKEVKVRK